MQRGAPFLVGKDLWKAINGEQDEEPTLKSPFGTGNIRREHLNCLGDVRGNNAVRTNLEELKNYPSIKYLRWPLNLTSSNDILQDAIKRKNILERQDGPHYMNQKSQAGCITNSGNVELPPYKEYKMFPDETVLPPSKVVSKTPTWNGKKSGTTYIQGLNRNNGYQWHTEENNSMLVKEGIALNVKPKQKSYSAAKHCAQESISKESCCRFCFKNGEVPLYYQSHLLKDEAGNIVCPILRKYTCPCCGATGENAHTIRHCPLNKNYFDSLPQHGKILRRNAAGRITSFRF